MKTKTMNPTLAKILLATIIAVLIITTFVQITPAASQPTSSQLQKISRQLTRLEKKIDHNTIEYGEITNKGTLLVFKDGSKMLIGDQRGK